MAKSTAKRTARKPAVGLIMGSQSDWATMRHAAETLEALGVPFEARIISAHRTPKRMMSYAAAAKGARPEGDHRRRRRRRPSARHDRLHDAPAGAGRAGRKRRAEGPGQPSFHRPDAGRHPGRHARHWPRRRRECRRFWRPASSVLATSRSWPRWKDGGPARPAPWPRRRPTRPRRRIAGGHESDQAPAARVRPSASWAAASWAA